MEKAQKRHCRALKKIDRQRYGLAIPPWLHFYCFTFVVVVVVVFLNAGFGLLLNYGDAMLTRFLVARLMNPMKAVKMLVSWKKWREEFVPLGFIPDSEGPDELKAKKIYLQGPTPIQERENQFGLMNSQSYPLDGNELGHSSDNWDRRPPHAVIDESFVSGSPLVMTPAIDYDMQEGQKELFKDKKSKGQDSLEKRKIEATTRKGKPSKLGPSTEAQARAANLRAFKADLQKMTKENV
ncbi:hypothetical protein IFM89_034781 [Coptis chinensis]|uniref:Uncharacterized protein n=1 Tax=Coptis chinensis TaxID=261450 RepID=A0A835HAW3_9MAGN|nr:hypothetical protein IFM89_034781 [Coptis chinensis]